MPNYYKLVDDVIKESDILLLVIDARRIVDSINKELEDKIRYYHKKFVYVINKVDLVSKDEQKKLKLPNSIEVSARIHLSTIRLIRMLMRLGEGKEVTVGVIGYPNTGKSTLINALRGRHSAPTSSSSGFTKGLQKVRINQKIMLIDTPGVYSYGDRSQLSHAAIGAVDVDQLKDIEGAAMLLIEQSEGKIEKHYGVEKKDDPLETLEEIALKSHILKKGGLPDTGRMARQIVSLWQKGKIR